jgi:hypothetical protein
MPNLYRSESSDPKSNAQRNLSGRTHYVDDDTLRFHKSRVLSARPIDGGLLFAIVTSDAKDHQGRTRGFRYVIFDLFGNLVERNPAALDMEWFKNSEKALKAMWAAVNAMDAVAITQTAMERAKKQHADEMYRVTRDISELQKSGKLTPINSAA